MGTRELIDSSDDEDDDDNDVKKKDVKIEKDESTDVKATANDNTPLTEHISTSQEETAECTEKEEIAKITQQSATLENNDTIDTSFASNPPTAQQKTDSGNNSNELMTDKKEGYDITTPITTTNSSSTAEHDEPQTDSATSITANSSNILDTKENLSPPSSDPQKDSEDKQPKTETETDPNTSGSESDKTKADQVPLDAVTLQEPTDPASTENNTTATKATDIKSDADDALKTKKKKEPRTIEVEEFYVKYKSFSYLHCEWKTEEELMKGDKRVNGKIKRFKQKMSNNANIFEFIEEDPFNPDYVEVDRVLDMSEVNDPTTGKVTKNYLVKWRSLPYDEATWELEDDIDPEKLAQFHRFHKCNNTVCAFVYHNNGLKNYVIAII